MDSSTADALGLSRAILCNDVLVKRLQDMERTGLVYRGLMRHVKKILKSYFSLCKVHRDFGDVFSEIGIREPHENASNAFLKFSESHREFEKSGFKLLKTLKPMLSDLNTYLNKAIPDTKLTIKKYADIKFEYLSYCLKVKEMDDEEYSYAALQEPLYRVETGNYEYRLILRCRQLSREKFAKMRSDVLVKMELLDQKHVQDTVHQLQRLITTMQAFHDECAAVLRGAEDLFPIEVDLSSTMLGLSVTDSTRVFHDEVEEDEDDVVGGEVTRSPMRKEKDFFGAEEADEQPEGGSLIDLKPDAPIIDLN